MRRERKEYEDMYRMGKMLMDAEKVEEDKPKLKYRHMTDSDLYDAFEEVMDDIKENINDLSLWIKCHAVRVSSISVEELADNYYTLKVIQKEMLHRGILRRR